jgi:hypothetical protein
MAVVGRDHVVSTGDLGWVLVHDSASNIAEGEDTGLSVVPDIVVQRHRGTMKQLAVDNTGTEPGYKA